MELFTATTAPFGFLAGGQSQLDGSFMRTFMDMDRQDAGDESNEELMYNMLMWELEGQMIRMEQLEKKRSVSSSNQNAAADYTWLERAPSSNKPKTVIPKRLKLELDNLGRKIKPANTNIAIKRFRDKLLGNEPPIEEVPLLFSSVLRSVISEQATEDKQRMLDSQLSVASRVMQSLNRTNRVGIMDIESCTGGLAAENDVEAVDDSQYLPSSSSDPTKWAYSNSTEDDHTEHREQSSPTCESDGYFIGLTNSGGRMRAYGELDMDIVDIAEDIL